MLKRRELRTIRLLYDSYNGVDGFKDIINEAERIGYSLFDVVYARITHKKDETYEGPAVLLEREGEMAVVSVRDKKFRLHSCRDLGETIIKDLSSVVADEA